MKNWNFNGSLKENNKRVLTEAEGSVNMISARKDPSVSFNNDNGTLRMTLNIPAGSGGETESGVGRTYVTEDGESRGEYFNIYEAPEGTDYIGNAWGYGSHAEGGSLWRSKVSQTPSYLEYDAQKIPYDIIGNIDNLQMLPHSLNSKKSRECYSVLEYCLHKVVGDRFDDFKF